MKIITDKEWRKYQDYIQMLENQFKEKETEYNKLKREHEELEKKYKRLKMEAFLKK